MFGTTAHVAVERAVLPVPRVCEIETVMFVRPPATAQRKTTLSSRERQLLLRFVTTGSPGVRKAFNGFQSADTYR